MENTYGYIRTSRQRIQGTAGNAPEVQAHQFLQEGEQSANLHNAFFFTRGQAAQLLRVSRRNVNYAGRVLSEGSPAGPFSARDIGDHSSIPARRVLVTVTFAA